MVAPLGRHPSTKRQRYITDAQRTKIREDVPKRNLKYQSHESMASLCPSQLYRELQVIPEGTRKVLT